MLRYMGIACAYLWDNIEQTQGKVDLREPEISNSEMRAEAYKSE